MSTDLRKRSEYSVCRAPVRLTEKGANPQAGQPHLVGQLLQAPLIRWHPQRSQALPLAARVDGGVNHFHGHHERASGARGAGERLLDWRHWDTSLRALVRGPQDGGGLRKAGVQHTPLSVTCRSAAGCSPSTARRKQNTKRGSREQQSERRPVAAPERGDQAARVTAKRAEPRWW